MSLTSSMSIAVTGLNAQSASITTVSNNLANTSTTSYKASGTNFEELVDSSDGSGTGVSASSSYNNDSQGSITAEDVSTYLAISGNGYYAVATGTTNADGTTTIGTDVYYTRDGDFSLNADGYLVNSEGYYLLGYTEDASTGTVGTTLTAIQVSSLTNAPVATSNVDYSANLPSSATVGTTTAATTITIYDAQGTAHDLSYSWEKTGTNEWQLNVTAADGSYDATLGTSDYTTSATFYFNTDGTLDYIDYSGSSSGDALVFDLNYDGSGAVTLDASFTGITQYDDTDISVETFDQDGVPSGSFSDIEIDTSGNVTIDYSNGQAVAYYEIPVATFLNSNGLEAVDGNAYKATTSSGTATYNQAGTSGAGTITSNALEDSTVDIATEFTTMITAQQVYSANSKVITAASDMMKTAVELA